MSVMMLPPGQLARLISDRLRHARSRTGGRAGKASEIAWIVQRSLEEGGVHCETTPSMEDLKGFLIASPRGAEITVSERYSQMFELLLSRSLNVSRETEAAKLRMGPNLLRVFLYAKMPSEFAVQNKRLGNQDGRVLYSITLSTDDLTPSTDDVK